jgi:hypothetical protein
MSNQNESKAYFDAESLKRFVEAEGKEVKVVVCYLWQNNISKNETVELIDNIEFWFTDRTKLTISTNKDNSGLEVIDYDYEKDKAEMEAEFEGKIKIFGVNASSTKMWSDVIGKKLTSVQLTKENDNYLSDSILINFEEERRTVSLSPLDGLIIDYYED